MVSLYRRRLSRRQESSFPLRILFGPEHDLLHVRPSESGAYEWWYFDALSDDERWAVVVIFFLGSPMSPYYKAVARGKNPDPRDWCGVFVSVHEMTPHSGWRERAYAYNLYRGGKFSGERPDVAIGGSRMTSTNGATLWNLEVNEPGLWLGRTHVAMTFAAPGKLALPPGGPPNDAAAADHTWVCVAPVCRARGTVTLPGGQTIPFNGNGYHDHNFGRLPFHDTAIWYWGRALLRGNDGTTRTTVLYHLEAPNGNVNATLLLFGAGGEPRLAASPENALLSRPTRNAYGLRHAQIVEMIAPLMDAGGARGRACFPARTGALLEGPFYRRLPLQVELEQDSWRGKGEGIGEVFRPANLCGPIASRALWSRLRRRNY